MASRPYNSPGVTVSETPNPTFAPFIASPSVIGIVGEAAGKESATESVTLSGTTPVTLLYTGVDDSSVVVKSSSTGLVLDPGTYKIVAGADPDVDVIGDEPYTIERRAVATAPTLATGTGTLTGTYVYAVSFVNAEGETGIGAVSADIILTADGVDLTAIVAGPAGTTARNVYRKKTSSGGDNKFHLVATINDNTTLLLNDETTSDATAQGDGITTFGTAQPVDGIASNDVVYVTYDYTDNHYYDPTSFDDYNDISNKYGAPFDEDGLINSPLTFAARLAFVNGASSVVAVAAAGSTVSDYEEALGLLEQDETVRIVVAASGNAAVGSAVVTHVQKMINLGQYRFGVIGRDGVETPVTAATLRAAAQAYNSEAVRFVSPAIFEMQNSVTGKPLLVGGQYMASALAGMYAARDVQVPLTRKTVSGFTRLGELRSATDLALDNGSGLLAIEVQGDVMRVRHDITTNVGSISARESSVVRSKYEMALRLRNNLDSSVVGLVLPQSQSAGVVRGVVVGILSQLVNEEVISDFSDVNARVQSNDPTAIEVRFTYVPSYPINNIAVIFTINTNTGEFTLV